MRGLTDRPHVARVCKVEHRLLVTALHLDVTDATTSHKAHLVARFLVSTKSNVHFICVLEDIELVFFLVNDRRCKLIAVVSIEDVAFLAV